MPQLDLFNNPVPSVSMEMKIVRSYVRRKKVNIGNEFVSKDYDFTANAVNSAEVKTGSKINRDRLVKQNLRVLKLILAGGRVNMNHAYEVGVGTPHSRFADVRTWLSQHDVILHDAMTIITNRAGEQISCKEYWIDAADIEKITKIIESWDK